MSFYLFVGELIEAQVWFIQEVGLHRSLLCPEHRWGNALAVGVEGVDDGQAEGKVDLVERAPTTPFLGTSLPAPGAVPLRQKIADPSEERAPGAKKTARSEPSPYGCYLASRPYTEEVRFRSIYLRYPEEIVERAGEETQRLVYRLRAARKGQTDTTGVRYAHCAVPKAEGAKEATLKQVVRPNERDAVRKTILNASSKKESTKSCRAVLDYCVGPPGHPYDHCVWEVRCGGDDSSGDDQGGDDWGGPGGEDGGGGGGYEDPYPDDETGGVGDDGSGGDDSEDCEDVVNPPPGSDCAPAEPEINPCESDNPPDYCDEAGSCYDRNIANENDRKIIQGLEDNGEFTELWKKSNPNASDQSKREERGGWIVKEGGGYKIVEFDEAQESGPDYGPFGVDGVNNKARPSGTVATIHTTPFENGEVIDDVDLIRRFLKENNYQNRDPEKIADAGLLDYDSEPSELSGGDFPAAAETDVKGYLIDGTNVFSYDSVRGVDLATKRCGY